MLAMNRPAVKVLPQRVALAARGAGVGEAVLAHAALLHIGVLLQLRHSVRVRVLAEIHGEPAVVEANVLDAGCGQKGKQSGGLTEGS